MSDGKRILRSKNNPAKRRRLDPERRQTEILDAAYKLFAAKGYGLTTLSDIAREAGAAKGLVLFYFKIKEDVFKAVVRRAIPPILDGLSDESFVGTASAKELFVRSMRQLYGYLFGSAEAKVILRLLMEEGRRFPELTAFYHSEVIVRGNATLARIVALGIERGEFSIALDKNVTRVLLGPLVSAVLFQLLYSDIERIDIEQLFKVHMELALRALTARSGAAEATKLAVSNIRESRSAS